MNIPKKWVKSTIKVYVKVDARIEPNSKLYTFKLKRDYLSWRGKLETEIIYSEDFRAVNPPIDESKYLQNHFIYAKLWNYQKEIEKALKKKDWRAAGLEALASSSIFEKDKFISDFIESL